MVVVDGVVVVVVAAAVAATATSSLTTAAGCWVVKRRRLLLLALIVDGAKAETRGRPRRAKVNAKEEENTYEVSRKLLVDNDKLFVVKQDTMLDLVTVEPVFFKENTAVVKNLPDGTKLLSKVIPGAYVGMKVKIFTDDRTALNN